jgi:hypothetical protein
MGRQAATVVLAEGCVIATRGETVAVAVAATE